MPAINIMIKPVSGLCNLECEYCFYKDEMKKRDTALYGFMTYTVLEEVIKKTLEYATLECSIIFQGGEPTLAGLDFYKKCLEYEKKYNINNVQINHAIQTNGYGLDDAWCQFFCENHFLVGLSLDGVETTHNTFRKTCNGEDTYLRTLRAASLLEEKHVDFNILTVVHRETASHIREIYESYKEYGFKWQQYIVCLDPLWEKPGRRPYSISPREYSEFLTELFELWSEDLEKNEQPYIRQFENYIGILMGQQPEACEHRGVCSFQNVIEADGSVYPCDFYMLDEYKLGNLLVDDYPILERRKANSSFGVKSSVISSECKQCIYFGLCRGGCRRHREMDMDDMGKNYYCQAYKAFFQKCLPRMQQIAYVCSSMRAN